MYTHKTHAHIKSVIYLEVIQENSTFYDTSKVSLVKSSGCNKNNN